jgi:pyruvate formate lyase activating enzyme
VQQKRIPGLSRVRTPPHASCRSVTAALRREETATEPDTPSLEPQEARFFDRLPAKEVRCLLCPRNCLIREGERGACRTRENRGGTLYSLVYGKPCAVSVEPIEKAPLYHFKPGHRRLCLATVGCNLTCSYCQNWHISQRTVEEVHCQSLSPDDAVSLALESGVVSICFTFTEPVVCFEYLFDTARLAREGGLHTAMVSNGYINPDPLQQLLTVMDAVKIDLKAFTDDFYRSVSSVRLEPVLKTLEIIAEGGTWLEIVNLVVPTLNDDPKDINRMCRWIEQHLGSGVVLHFTRFFPMYRLTSIPATPLESLERAHRVARESGLQYVYIGNVPGHPCNSTYCAYCGELLINRVQFEIVENRVIGGICPSCGGSIPGIW